MKKLRGVAIGPGFGLPQDPHEPAATLCRKLTNRTRSAVSVQDDVRLRLAGASLPHQISVIPPHQGTQGKRALFLDQTATQGVQLELTGD